MRPMYGTRKSMDMKEVRKMLENLCDKVLASIPYYPHAITGRCISKKLGLRGNELRWAIDKLCHRPGVHLCEDYFGQKDTAYSLVDFSKED